MTNVLAMVTLTNQRVSKNLGLSATNYTITSLHEYWPYTISVAGRTSKGAGIRTLRKVTTIDDGKNFAKFFRMFS